MALKKGTINFFLGLTILCFIIRLLCAGWYLMLFFWLIIPYYMLHFWGHYRILKQEVLYKKYKLLIYISSLLLIALTFLQFDGGDNRAYFLIDGVIYLLFNKTIFPEPPLGYSIIRVVVALFIIDTLINVFLLIKSYMLKEQLKDENR